MGVQVNSVSLMCVFDKAILGIALGVSIGVSKLLSVFVERRFVSGMCGTRKLWIE